MKKFSIKLLTTIIVDVDEAVGIPGEKISIFIFLDLALINLVVEQHWTSV